MEKIKILLLDDAPNDLDNLFNKVNCSLDNNDFLDKVVIDKTDSYVEAKSLISRSRNDKQFYNILFIYINLSENDGPREGGMELMKKAYDTYPFAKIIPWSNNVGIPTEYSKLSIQGDIIDGFKKDLTETGFENLFIDLVKDCLNKYYLPDIFLNHKSIEEGIIASDLQGKSQAEIKSLLEALNVLFRDKERMRNENVLFRLIMILYHRCLEVYCTKRKPKQLNGETLHSSTHTSGNTEIDSDDTALNKIKSFSTTENYRYGYQLNWLRNESVHPDPKKDRNKKNNKEECKIQLTLTNVLFANIVLAIYAAPSLKDIQSERIELYGDATGERGLHWLKNAINYIKN